MSLTYSSTGSAYPDRLARSSSCRHAGCASVGCWLPKAMALTNAPQMCGPSRTKVDQAVQAGHTLEGGRCHAFIARACGGASYAGLDEGPRHRQRPHSAIGTTSRFGTMSEQAFESRLSGASAKAIAQHYDVGTGFYRLWLDRHLTYSAARWGGPPPGRGRRSQSGTGAGSQAGLSSQGGRHRARCQAARHRLWLGLDAAPGG
jgi:hypothetical protein